MSFPDNDEPTPAPGEAIHNDDGSIDFAEGDEQTPALADIDHDANLAEAMDESELSRIATMLLEGIEADEESNAEMYAIFKAGLEFVVVKPGARLDKPFAGAAGCVHPLLLEAGVRFAANARGEMLPAEGPVKAAVFGDGGDAQEALAKRKVDWLNYYLTQKDEDYYPDYDQMLLLVGFYGSMFRKIYRDPARRGMPVSRALSPHDSIVSYAATSLHGSERVTHVEHRASKADITKLQLKAWYRDVDLAMPMDDEADVGQRLIDEAEGREASGRPEDATYKLYHCHCLLDLEGLEHVDDDGEPTGLPLPYIVTIEPESRQILRLARNWQQGDPELLPREYYVHYQYMPGFGFYGWGLIHLLGSVADALTMMRRQSLNAFTLSSFPGGVRVKGARPEASNNAIGPGEFKELDTGGLPIQQALMMLPYRDVPASFEPIMQELLSSGQRLGSIGDAAVGEGREDALPGTVIALIEQSVKLESSVLKRLHTAQRKELRLLADLFGSDKDAKYDYIVGGQRGMALAADFADNEDVIPVSDPNIPTRTQRLAQAQGILSVAQQSNGMIDVREALKQFLETLGKSDQEIAELMPPPQQGQPSDPVTEYAAVLKGLPLAAGPQQDHMAHIQAHMAQLSTPGLNQTPAYQPLLAHVADHAGLYYAGEASRLTGIPMLPGQIPPQQQAQVTSAVAAMSDKLRLSLAQLQPQTGADPIEQAKLEVEKQKLQQTQMKMQMDFADNRRKAGEAQLQHQNELDKLQMQIADNARDRQQSAMLNQNETVRALLGVRKAEIESGADVRTAQVERDATIAEGLIGHATTAAQGKADVEVSKNHVDAEKHKAEAAKANAAKARLKPTPK